MDEATEQDFGRLTLERVQVGCQFVMSDAAARAITVATTRDQVSRATVHAFTAYLMGNTVHTDVRQYRHPATWWQGFKESVFPGWLRRHYPVRYTEVSRETKFTHVCPHLNIEAREEERYHLQWLTPPNHLSRLVKR